MSTNKRQPQRGPQGKATPRGTGRKKGSEGRVGNRPKAGSRAKRAQAVEPVDVIEPVVTTPPPPRPTLPVIAVVGRPNVGKSTLFNRIVGGHNAIVEDQPGVTRDRRYGDADWAGKAFRMVDTGGLDLAAARAAHKTKTPGMSPVIAGSIVDQAMRAVDEASAILFVTDATEGLTNGDREAADVLRRAGKPVVWVANKVDGANKEQLTGELYEMGADRVIGISAQHGRNIAELLDAILEKIPDAPKYEEAPREYPIRVALVGRPNAGKSSLVNKLLGEERVIVDDTPGTTRDPVDMPFEWTSKGELHKFVLIDTAGIRRRARVEAPMEKIAVAMAEKAIGRCDVTVLMIDADGGVGEQDAKIAGACEEAGRALVIAFNKRDLITEQEEKKQREELQRKLQFVPWAKLLFISARTGHGIKRLLDTIVEVNGNFRKRVPTGELNRFFEGLVERHPPSVYRGHPVKLYYITQATVAPPTFVLSVNFPEGVHFSYRRYLANQMREQFGFDGTPVRIITRARGGKKK